MQDMLIRMPMIRQDRGFGEVVESVCYRRDINTRVTRLWNIRYMTWHVKIQGDDWNVWNCWCSKSLILDDFGTSWNSFTDYASTHACPWISHLVVFNPSVHGCLSVLHTAGSICDGIDLYRDLASIDRSGIWRGTHTHNKYTIIATKVWKS